MKHLSLVTVRIDGWSPFLYLANWTVSSHFKIPPSFWYDSPVSLNLSCSIEDTLNRSARSGPQDALHNMEVDVTPDHALFACHAIG